MNSLIHVAQPYDLPYIAEASDGILPYIDLRVHPSEIDRIPELRGKPDLKELVAVLNRQHGPFMTHGSAFALARPYERAGEIPLSEESRTASRWCTSYVTFSFWHLSQNKPENYVSL
jgi:hypothetical protein